MTPAALIAVLALATPPPTESGVEAKLAKPEQPFELSGRFEARESIASAKPAGGQAGPWTGQMSIGRAVVGIGWKHESLKVVVEADLADDAELKDAWARLDLGPGAVRAGRFKIASSAIESESSWKLPVTRRGELHGLLEDALQISGRSNGAALLARSKTGLAPEASIGVWQALAADGDERRGGDSELFGQCGGARASITPGPVTLGAFGSFRTQEAALGGEPARHWAGGTDVMLDLDLGLRAWVEGIGGSSPYTAEGAGNEAHFASARVIAGWRLGPPGKNAPFVEPFFMAGALDPDVTMRNDLATETAIGVNAGRWDRWRVQLELSETKLQPNVPLAMVERAETASRKSVTLQMGVSF